MQCVLCSVGAGVKSCGKANGDAVAREVYRFLTDRFAPPSHNRYQHDIYQQDQIDLRTLGQYDIPYVIWAHPAILIVDLSDSEAKLC